MVDEKKTTQLDLETPAEDKKVSNRRKYRDENWTDEQVTARKAKLTVKEIPAGYIKFAEVDKKFKELGIPVSRLVRASGRDRCMYSALDPVFQPVYVGSVRYLPGAVLTVGIKLMEDPNFARTPRKPKKDKADGAKGAGAAKTSGKVPAPRAERKKTVKVIPQK